MKNRELIFLAHFLAKSFFFATRQKILKIQLQVLMMMLLPVFLHLAGKLVFYFDFWGPPFSYLSISNLNYNSRDINSIKCILRYISIRLISYKKGNKNEFKIFWDKKLNKKLTVGATNPEKFFMEYSTGPLHRYIVSFSGKLKMVKIDKSKKLKNHGLIKIPYII